MSVDDRIRSAFDGADETWDLGLEPRLGDVRRRHTRGLAVRRGLASLAASAAVVTGVLLATGRAPGGDAAPDPVGPPSSPAVTQGPSSGMTVLQGRWRTASWDEATIRQAMTSVGDAGFADEVVAGLPPTPFRLVWDVDRGTAQLRAVGRGETTVLDEIALDVDGGIVTMSPRFADGSTSHRFEISGDQLRLRFVSTTEGAQDGVPGAVWQRLLYDAAGFTRG